MPSAMLPWNEADRLAALHSYQILDTAREETFDGLSILAARLIGCPIALVSLVDESRQWFKARHGLNATEAPRNTSFCAHAILDPSHALVVADAMADVRFADNPLVTGKPGIRFYAGMPLINAEGYALGTLCLMDYAPRAIDADDLDTLSHLARAVMSSMELHRTRKLAQATTHSPAGCIAKVIEALPTALVLAEAGGRIRITNRLVGRMFGYKCAYLEGKPVEQLLPGRFRQQYADLLQGLSSDASCSMADGQALAGLREDGTEFPLELSLGPIQVDGEPMVLTAMIDIGRRRRFEQESDQRRQDLERSNADLQEFANTASHDLKAPLRAIGHLAEWIRTDVDKVGHPDTIENLKLLQGRVTRLQKLLDGLLAYSRAGRTNAAIEDVDIGGVVRDVTAMLELPQGFKIVCEGGMPVIRTYRAPIDTVFKNLISNGLQHHDRSTGRIAVSMRLFDQMAEFRISDDGPGIPRRFHDRIFMAFQTLKPRDDAEASGMGLAIVKRHVESNGGQIRVESDPPTRGTTFVITWRLSLPC